ncbi:transposase [Desulfonatronovibrio hydrogenovorans]|uniref:transposase n=1 Tax=Desulfonatronovibrio hydrogenovorans TaxID=53245 RepID=UPI000491E3BD|nr:transposase [Desulfonatronovibrio hydrogenovorans]
MRLNTYEHIIKSRKSAHKFLLKFCWKNHQRFCPRCSNRKLYSLGSGRRRCSRCKYTFHDFSLRFINFARLSPRQWLRFIKLFELEVDPDMMADQLGVSYNTIRKALTISRLSVLAGSLDGPQIIKNLKLVSLLRNSSAPDFPSPVLGILPSRGKVFIDYIPDLTLETLLHFRLNFFLRTRCMGRIIYTAPYKKYLSLIAWDDGFFSHRKISYERDKLPLDTHKEFWPYASSKLKKFRTVNPLRLLLYLKELEFRFNHSNEDPFPALCSRLCSFVPDLE